MFKTSAANRAFLSSVVKKIHIIIINTYFTLTQIHPFDNGVFEWPTTYFFYSLATWKFVVLTDILFIFSKLVLPQINHNPKHRTGLHPKKAMNYLLVVWLFYGSSHLYLALVISPKTSTVCWCRQSSIMYTHE